MKPDTDYDYDFEAGRNLTERLAAAERERDESARALNNCWGHKVRVLKELDVVRIERDAALAKAEEWENCAGNLESKRLAMCARIEALAADWEELRQLLEEAK